MNWRPLLIMGLSLGLAGLARGEEPQTPDPQALAMVDAMLSKCAEIDPANATRYHGQGKMLTQGASEEAIAKVRKSDAYKQAFEAATESVADTTADSKDAVKTCKDTLAPTQ